MRESESSPVAVRRAPRATVPRLALAALALATPLAAAEPGAELVPLRRGKLWGYADRAGQVVIAPAYDRALRFAEGRARVARGGRWGVVDPLGREVVALEYSSLGPYSEGFAPACRDTEVSTGVTEGVGRSERPVARQACGFLDRDGKLAVPLRYHGVNWFEQGVAQVQMHRESPCLVAQEWGLVDSAGREVLPVRYCYVSPPSEGLVRVTYEDHSLDVRRFGYHALDGRVVIPKLPYDGAHERWSEGVIGVRKDGKFGFLDRTGKEVVPLRYDSAYPFAGGLAAVELAGKWGFVDHAGQLVVPAQYDEVESFQDDLAWVVREKSAGFVDRTGKLVVALDFDGWVDRQARPWWSEGRRGMKAKDGGWGFVDRQGRWVVPPVYDWVRPCSEGLCAVEKDGLWGFVDLDGKLVIPHRYRRLETTFEGGLAFVSRRLRDDLPHFADGWIDATGREFFDEPPLF